MQYEPISKLWLLNVPIELNYTHTLLFDNKQEQQNYFLDSQKVVKDLSNMKSTYLRENGNIVVPFNRDEILNVNYLVYINPNFANKYYYCFVNNIEYVSQNSCSISISTDIFQTYIFDVSLKTALVDRYIPSKKDDLVGAFTYPENLECGVPQINKIDTTSSYNFMVPVFVIAINGVWNGSSWLTQTPNGCQINNTPQAMSFIFTGSSATARDWLQAINNAGLGERIISFFTVPAIAFNGLNGKSWPLWVGNTDSVFSDDIKTININMDTLPLQRPTSFFDNLTGGSYTPKNNKLWTYPFSYLVNSPQGGQPKIYRYENFTLAPHTTEINFSVASEISPNARIIFIPNGYKVESRLNYNEVNVSADYPTLSYVTDVFNNWLMKNEEILNLTQTNRDNLYDIATDYNDNQRTINQLNNTLSVVKNGVSGISSAVMGDYAGAISTGIVGQLQTGLNAYADEVNYEHQRSLNAQNYSFQTNLQMAQVRKESLTPANVTAGSNSLAIYNSFITEDVMVHYCIKIEYAKRIDEYFSRFGYKVNNFMNLEDTLKTRSNWNYVKTTNCIITGNITQANLEALQQIFNNGITLWHNPDTYLDYTQENN